MDVKNQTLVPELNENISSHSLYQCLDFLHIKLAEGTFSDIHLDLNDTVPVIISTLLTNAGIKNRLDAIKDEYSLGSLNPPCIVHWDLHHYVVLTGINEAGLKVWDPYLGCRVYSNMEFLEFANKPGYVNHAVSLASCPLEPNENILQSQHLSECLAREKSEERFLLKKLTPLAYLACHVGVNFSRSMVYAACFVWERLLSPRIYLGPQRNLSSFMGMSDNQARLFAIKNIAELALNMGYTGYLLKKIRKPRTIEWVDKKIAVPAEFLDGSSFEGQCIVELIHLYDPITAVYSIIRQLPKERDFVVYGNPWDENMISLCEQACQSHGRTLEIIAPAGKASFFKLMKRAKSGAHIILFADGNPLFISDEASGLQLARSFEACKLWGRQAYMTVTGALLAKKTSANLYIAGLQRGQRPSVQVANVSSGTVENIDCIMQRKASQVGNMIKQNPQGWLFWRNAETYFHDYKSIFTVK